MANIFPFQTFNEGGQYTILADIENNDLYPKFLEIFEKHGYSGNGYCWEGHIRQILEKNDIDLLNHIDFDPEAGGFFAYADTFENQLKFVEILGPIFSDLSVVEDYIISADRTRIDD